MAIGPTSAEECTEGVRHLLLDVDADTGSTRIRAHRVDVGGHSRDLRQRNRVGKFAGTAPAQKASEFDLARLAPQFVTFLDLADHLELLEGRIERVGQGAYTARRRYRKIEHAAAKRPASSVPFRGRAVGVAPAIAGVIEG